MLKEIEENQMRIKRKGEVFEENCAGSIEQLVWLQNLLEEEVASLKKKRKHKKNQFLDLLDKVVLKVFEKEN